METKKVTMIGKQVNKPSKEKIIDVIKMHEDMSISEKGTKSIFYRVVIPSSVLKRLGVMHVEHIAFRKKGNDVQLIRMATYTKKIRQFMGIKKILSRNRICLPKTVVTFLKIADGDYLQFIELKKSDIRLRKLKVGHHYFPYIHNN